MNAKKLGFAFLMAWIVIMAAGTVLTFTGVVHESLWYDESYSAAIVNHSLADIVSITSGDSHPPLYYMMLRIFTLVFGNSVFAMRSFSALGAVALAAWGIGPVRRALGNRFGLIYTLLTFAIPITISMAQEVRMYIWAAFWVTGSALYGYLAYKEGRIKDWVIFSVCSLCAAYMHYYALLAIMMICALLLVTMLVEKKKIVSFLCAAGAVVAGYIPWIIQLSGQISRIGARFWISPMTWEVVKGVLIYPFSNKFSTAFSPWASTFIGIAFCISAALILFGIAYRIVRKDESVKLSILAVGAYLLTILAGIVASFVIRPVLIERYMVPVLGLFIIGLAYGIGNLGKNVLPIIGCATIIAFSVPQTSFTLTCRFNGPMNEAVEYLEQQIQPEDIFLHIDEHTLGTFCYYFPDNMNYYYEREGYGGFSNYDAFEPQGVMLDSLDEIDEGGRIWLVQRYNSPDMLSLPQWMGSGALKITGDVAHFDIDTSWYGFMVYPMALGDKGD